MQNISKTEKQTAIQSFEEGLESLARLLLPEIRAFFESEEGQKIFEEYETSMLNGGETGE